MGEDKTIAEMRHNVIEYAISLDNFLEEEIMDYFGLDAWRASYHMKLQREREVFKESFLKTTLSKKFDIIERIIKDLNEELDKDFRKDIQRFCYIRNMFAHTLYPEILKESMPKMLIDLKKEEQEDWKKMYIEAKTLYIKLIQEIDSKLYFEEPRRKKHERFEDIQLKKIIKHYEDLLSQKDNEKT